MSKITRDDVLKLARLSRLTLSEDEVEHFTVELANIIQYVDQLKDVDVSGLEPTDQVTGLVNVMREDEIIDYGAKPDALLSNAPSMLENQIKVRRVIE